MNTFMHIHSRREKKKDCKTTHCSTTALALKTASESEKMLLSYHTLQSAIFFDKLTKHPFRSLLLLLRR